MYRSRVLKEVVEAKKYKETNILLTSKQEDMYVWKGFLTGPQGSPYQDGIFEIKINLPSNYPMAAPKIIFITKIFHPNVNYDTGEICLDVLKDQWTPAWTLESACVAILDLMNHPNPDSPLNCDAGNLMRAGDIQAFNQMATMYTIENAISKKEFEHRLKLVMESTTSS